MHRVRMSQAPRIRTRPLPIVERTHNEGTSAQTRAWGLCNISLMRVGRLPGLSAISTIQVDAALDHVASLPSQAVAPASSSARHPRAPPARPAHLLPHQFAWHWFRAQPRGASAVASARGKRARPSRLSLGRRLHPRRLGGLQGLEVGCKALGWAARFLGAKSERSGREKVSGRPQIAATPSPHLPPTRGIPPRGALERIEAKTWRGSSRSRSDHAGEHERFCAEK